MRLLGDVELRHREAGLRRLPTRAATALLALLVLAAPRSMTREELIDLLWPQAGIDAGRNRLGILQLRFGELKEIVTLE